MPNALTRIWRAVGRARAWWVKHVPRRRRLLDEKRAAKKVLRPWVPSEYRRWKRATARYDMLGVDDPLSLLPRIVEIANRQAMQYMNWPDLPQAAFNRLHRRVAESADAFFRGFRNAFEQILEELRRTGRHRGGGQWSRRRRIVSMSTVLTSAMRFAHDAQGAVMVINPRRKGFRWHAIRYVRRPMEELEDSLKIYAYGLRHEFEVRARSVPAKAIHSFLIWKKEVAEEVAEKILEKGLRILPIHIKRNRLLQRLLSPIA